MKYKKFLQTALATLFVAATMSGVGSLATDKASAETAQAEWKTGNSQVSVTMNYDITKSNYGVGGDTPGYWRIRTYDSNTLVGYNAALKAEEFWYKTNYENLKPMFYETVANAENPSITLGYYDGDFKTTSTPVQSIASNSQSVCDYYGIIYTFTDTVTGEYFSVKMYNTAANTNQGKIALSVNGGEYQVDSTPLFGSFGGRFNGTKGSPQSGVFYLLNLKYDQDENKVKYSRSLEKSFDLGEYGLTSAFTSYKVDLSFDRIQPDKTAKLCVYSLNDYDLTGNIETQSVGPKILVKDAVAEEVFVGEEFTLPEVFAWDALDGNLSEDLVQTKVFAPDESPVAIENGKFTFSQEGAYTLEYRVTSLTKKIETVKKYEINALGKVPVATITLANNIPERFGVGGTLSLPTASISFQEETVQGYVVVEVDGKIVAHFDDVSVENKLVLEEVGKYKISYVYSSVYGYSNAYTCVVESVEILTIINPKLPKRIALGANDYVIEKGVAKIGKTAYEATIEILSPSGKQVALAEDGVFMPEEIGVHTFTYKAEVEGQTATETYFVDVQYVASGLFTANASVSAVIENVDAKYLMNGGTNGIAVVANTGGELRFKNVVDLSAIGRTPIIEFQPLTQSDGYSYIRTAVLTLTDIYDPNNVIKVKWEANRDAYQYVYMSVNFGHGYYGLGPDGKTPFIDKYGTNRGCSFRVDQYGMRAANNICFDLEDNEFLYNSYDGKYTTIIDADDINQVGDGNQWKGFTTGEVYVSMTLPDASDGGIIITSIAGQSLSGTKIEDVTAPAISVNTEKEYLKNGMPDGVVGMEYPIPKVVARDLISGEVKTVFAIEYKNAQGEWEEIALKNGAFLPEYAGQYKLVWKATDAMGNLSKTELPVTVNNSPNEITVNFSNKIGDVFVGDKVYVPAIDAVGGNGKISFTTEWTFNGVTIPFKAPGFYRATETGTLKVSVRVTDYLGKQTTKELTIEIKSPDLPVLSVLDVPTSVVKGATLVLPDFTAIDYTYEKGENGYEAQRKIYVNGQEINLANRTYAVTQDAGSVLTVRYEAIGRNGTSQKTYSVYVIEPKYISDYFIYNAEKVECNLNESYTEFSASETFTVQMPNPVSVQDMAICFYVDDAHIAAGKSVSVLLTDANDSSVQIRITVKRLDETRLGIYLNNQTEKLMNVPLKGDGAVYFSFNSSAKQISDSQGKKILGVETDLNGYLFEGFESGAAHILFTVNDVREKTSLRINQVGNQRFITTFLNGQAQNYVDRTAGQLSYEFTMVSKTVKLGEKVYVSSARAFDVLQNNASVTVTVESPNGVVCSNVSIAESFSFQAEEYGYYRITYTVKSGARTDRLPSYSIKVKDETPPTITISGTINGSCKVGSTLKLPTATVSDDGTAAEMMKLYVFVIDQSGRYVDVTEGLQYSVSKAGKYTVVYYVVDSDYNIARQEFVVWAK